VNPVHFRGQPASLGKFLLALLASPEIREKAVDLENPGFEVAAQEVDISASLDGLEDRKKKPEENILLSPGREELLDELGEIRQRAGCPEVLGNIEERLDEVALTDCDEVFSFFLVIKNSDQGHLFEAASKTVPEFPRAFGHATEEAFVAREKDGNLVLFADVEAAQDDGLGLIDGHGLLKGYAASVMFSALILSLKVVSSILRSDAA